MRLGSAASRENTGIFQGIDANQVSSNRVVGNVGENCNGTCTGRKTTLQLHLSGKGQAHHYRQICEELCSVSNLIENNQANSSVSYTKDSMERNRI